MTFQCTTMDESRSEIQSFYAGKTIFITGASGFMGKVLIEKLLYSCSDLDKIYILIRPKRGRDFDIRLDEMFKLPVSIAQIMHYHSSILCDISDQR